MLIYPVIKVLESYALPSLRSSLSRLFLFCAPGLHYSMSFTKSFEVTKVIHLSLKFIGKSILKSEQLGNPSFTIFELTCNLLVETFFRIETLIGLRIKKEFNFLQFFRAESSTRYWLFTYSNLPRSSAKKKERTVINVSVSVEINTPVGSVQSLEFPIETPESCVEYISEYSKDEE